MTPDQLVAGWSEDGEAWALNQMDHDIPFIAAVRSSAYEDMVGWQHLYQSSYSAMRIALDAHIIAVCDKLLAPPPPTPVTVPPTKPYTGALYEQLTPLQAWYKTLPQGYKPPPPQEAPKLVTIPTTVQEILSHASRILVT